METNIISSKVETRKLLDLTRQSYNPEQHKSFLQKISDSYFEPKFFEKQGKLYELIGIKIFKRGLLGLISKLGLRRRENETKGSNYYVGSNLSVDSLKRFEARTRLNEAAHVFYSSLGVYYAIDEFTNGNYVSGIIITAINLPQLYMIGLQRYNRARVYDLVDRIENRDIHLSK